MSLKTKHPFDEEFIPEGLEFKESYMHQAMGLYDNAKKLLFWKKLAIISSSAAALIAGAFVYLAFFNTPQNEQNNISSLPTTEQTFGSDQVPSAPKSSNAETNKEESNSSTNSTDTHSDSPSNLQSSADKRMQFSVGHTQDTIAIKEYISDNTVDAKKAFKLNSNSRAELSIEEENRSANALEQSDSFGKAESGTPSVTSEHFSELTELKTIQYSFPTLSPSLSPNTPLPNATLQTMAKAKPWMLFAGAGLSLTNGFATSRIASSLNPYAEAGIQAYLGRSFTGGIGLTLQSIGGLYSPIDFVQKEYGSGLTETNTLIHTNRLYYAGIRPQINWGLNEKWDVNASYQLDYLITGSNTITTQVSSTFDQPQTQAQKTTGYVAGFKDVNHSIAFGTTYHFGQKQAIGLHYQQGLTDITRNASFGEKRDLNSMLTLQYRFYFS